MQDYKDWVEGRVREMEVANARNDVRKVFAIVNQLSKKVKPPHKTLLQTVRETSSNLRCR